MSTAVQNDSDHKTRAAVEADLQRTPQLADPSQIGVAVHNGVVTLSGEVRSYPEKVAAGEAALHTRGVTAVANDVTVLYDAEMHTDAHVAACIVDALRSSPYVPEDDVDVEVRHGAVYLSGTVGWGHERVAAERAVRCVDGVRMLHNRIRIRPRVSASETKANVLAALSDHGSHTGDLITVDVDGNSVTLSGIVSSYLERLVAERAVSSMPRVRSVRNELRIVRT
jgi:osmotically-inducible protein OsmY